MTHATPVKSSKRYQSHEASEPTRSYDVRILHSLESVFEISNLRVLKAGIAAANSPTNVAPNAK
jgi:hypothetical protein